MSTAQRELTVTAVRLASMLCSGALELPQMPMLVKVRAEDNLFCMAFSVGVDTGSTNPGSIFSES